MNKKILILGIVVLCSLLAANFVQAQGNPLPYTPLEPIPGFTDSNTTDLASFLSALFKILFSLGALLAVGRLVVGGIMYMMTEVVNTKDTAKKQILSSFYGLFILAGSWLILNTINPNLLAFKNVAQPSINPSTGPGVGNKTPCGWGVARGAFSNQVALTIDVTGGNWNTFPLSSACAASLNTNGMKLKDNKSGKSVLVINIAKYPVSNFAAIIGTFNADCEAAGGTPKTAPDPQTNFKLFLCTKP